MQRLRQLTFASLECDHKTRREIFPERMDSLIPRARPEARDGHCIPLHRFRQRGMRRHENMRGAVSARPSVGANLAGSAKRLHRYRLAAGDMLLAQPCGDWKGPTIREIKGRATAETHCTGCSMWR